LRRALTPKSKVLILNNAQNPTGKVFTVEEMKQIAEILKEHPQVMVISDEVYDFLTFDDTKFVPFASIGENYNKTVTVWSGGKLFNATGWKCGWGIGPAQIIKQAGLHAYASLYCSNTPVQVAMSRSLDKSVAPGYKDGKVPVSFSITSKKWSHADKKLLNNSICPWKNSIFVNIRVL
jgi:aspartate/methionine/tyrosine aminotransferase